MMPATPVRVEFSNIADDPKALSELRSGLLNAEAARLLTEAINRRPAVDVGAR